jgi:hypothetical protein
VRIQRRLAAFDVPLSTERMLPDGLLWCNYRVVGDYTFKDAQDNPVDHLVVTLEEVPSRVWNCPVCEANHDGAKVLLSKTAIRLLAQQITHAQDAAAKAELFDRIVPVLMWNIARQMSI